MAKDPGTALTRWWGERPTWQKIAIGVGGGVVALGTGGAVIYAVATGGFVIETATVLVAGGTAAKVLAKARGRG